MLISFSGKKQTGKDTCADLLASHSPSLTFQRLNFADGVYEELARALWPAIINKETIAQKIQYMKDNKNHFRLLLQGWGTDYRRLLFGNDYWINKYRERLIKIPDTTVVITTDVRFLNELQCIEDLGGVVIRVTRPSSLVDKHQSETELDNYRFNYTIHNDGSIEELMNKVKQTIQQINEHL